MSLEIKQHFYTSFPELFRGRFKPREESSMCWGLDCGDERFNSLWSHCIALEQIANACGFDRNSQAWPEVMQVKEKFGTLGFHHAS